MRIIDENARRNINPYILQCLLATLTVLIVLLVLDVQLHTGIIATLGSTVFVIFAMPRYYSARTRPLIGGYLVGIAVGSACYYLSTLPALLNVPVSPDTVSIVFSALSVGLAIFLMAVTNTEHPPAAGMALSLVLNSWDYETIAFIISAVVSLAVIRRALIRVLINLV